MFKYFVLAAVAVALVADDPIANDDSVKKENASLQGRWLLETVEWSDLKINEFREVQRWQFAGDTLTRYEGSKKMELARIEIQPSQKPKQLDLLPIEDGEGGETDRFVARTKCLYSLDGDELNIAFTSTFLPGTPEEEKRRAIEWAKTRPKSLEPKEDVMVLILKREMGGAR